MTHNNTAKKMQKIIKRQINDRRYTFSILSISRLVWLRWTRFWDFSANRANPHQPGVTSHPNSLLMLISCSSHHHRLCGGRVRKSTESVMSIRKLQLGPLNYIYKLTTSWPSTKYIINIWCDLLFRPKAPNRLGKSYWVVRRNYDRRPPIDSYAVIKHEMCTPQFTAHDKSFADTRRHTHTHTHLEPHHNYVCCVRMRLRGNSSRKAAAAAAKERDGWFLQLLNYYW